MKKLGYLILLVLCIGLLLISCEKNEEELIKSTETISTQTIIIPDTNRTELTFTDIYPSYFHPMSGDGEAGTPYDFYFKEGGTVIYDKPFGIYMYGKMIENNYEGEILLFDTEEVFALKAGESYRAFIYSDGRISAEYEPYPEPHPVAMLNLYVISEDEYKIMLDDEKIYGKSNSINNLTDWL